LAMGPLMTDRPTLYYFHDGGFIDGVIRFVPVERCEHGKIDPHQVYGFPSHVWCHGSPTLEANDE
jgi:hypothetical protein